MRGKATSEKLRHRVTIERNLPANDVDNWVPYATNVPANIEYGSGVGWGREYFEAQKLNSEATVTITMRYRPDILPTMRVKHVEKVYNIIAPAASDPKHREIVLLAEEVGP